MSNPTTDDPNIDDLVATIQQNEALRRLLHTAASLPEGELRRMFADFVAQNQKDATPAIDSDFYDITGQLTLSQRATQMSVRRFMEREIRPIINDYWERGEFPHEIVPKFDELGQAFLGQGDYTFPPPSPLMFGILSMELARVDPSMTTFFAVHWGLCMGSIAMFGSPEQKARWLPPMQRFEQIGSWALTEPLVGSGAARGLQTTATRQGDTWILNGAKRWSGNATFAHVNVVWARDVGDNQVKGFVVERDTPGYVVEKLHGKIAKRAVENVDITLENCQVPEANRLPGVRSFRDVGRQLAPARAMVAWEATGIAMGTYEAALEYCREREQFGKPVAAFQLVQDKLVRMLGNLTAMQTMVLRLAQLEERDGVISHERASLAKVFCAEKMRETVALARGVMGGNGILLEHHVARLFADAEAVYSYEGTHEMNTLIVGRAITGFSAFV
jgi:glutaryl-CoA dehydrogenase